MKYQSIINTHGSVNFPVFLGERVYMREFFKKDGLPQDLSRWQNTVDAMLCGIDTDQPIYIMIDEKFVPAGEAQRRKGLHIDGYWNPGLSAHGYVGEFEGIIGEGGDCSTIDLSSLSEIQMEANTVYAGNVTCLHESIPVKEDCYRQLVRLNTPGWTP